jgi:hypothetical protein
LVGGPISLQFLEFPRSVYTFRKAAIAPAMTVPDSPTVANGVVYALETGEQTRQNPLAPGQPRLPAAEGAEFRATPVGHLQLYAFDAVSGKLLYASKNTIKDWVHFSEPVVA